VINDGDRPVSKAFYYALYYARFGHTLERFMADDTNDNIIRASIADDLTGLMLDKLPPLPWTYQTNSLVGKHLGSGNVYLVDANGRKIAAIYCSPEEKIAVAEFICSVSERANSASPA
jgi:hypothetical protein